MIWAFPSPSCEVISAGKIVLIDEVILVIIGVAHLD